MKIYFAGPLFTPYERGYIDECAAQLRADGFEVFVPHEHELALGTDVSAAWIFAKDRPGVEGANAMLAILDGPSVDDGTACEIGMFHALMQSDDSKKGIVGLLTDIRGSRGESIGRQPLRAGRDRGRRRDRRLVRAAQRRFGGSLGLSGGEPGAPLQGKKRRPGRGGTALEGSMKPFHGISPR